MKKILIVLFGLARILGVKDRPVEVVAVGDVMLGRSVNTVMIRKNDWDWPFEKTKKILSQADLTFGNLEAPIIKGCQPTDIGMRFCADERAGAGLTAAGFDAVSLANNHMMNYGDKGLMDTYQELEKQRIKGIKGEMTEIEKGGVQFGIVAWDGISEVLEVQEVQKVLQVVQGRTDVLIASFHWGNEYQEKPSARQRELAHAAIDGGAKIVIGHHPHWVQEVEEYKGGYIFYSLGNFVFDQMWSEKTREGVIARIWVTKDKLVGYELIKTKIYDWGQPRVE